jgi:hypothetical protein
LVQASGVYAAADQENDIVALTLDECIERAVGNNYQRVSIERQVNRLWEQHNELFEMSHSIQKQLDTLSRFEKLYENSSKGNSLTTDEAAELLIYQSIYGKTPPVYSPAEMFELFIKNRDFPHYSVWASIQNLETNKKLIDASTGMAVRQIFIGIVSAQEALELQLQLYDNMKKQNENMLVMYEKGLVSEINKFNAECSLEKQRLSIKKQKRSIDNMKMILKQKIGMPLNTDILLKFENKIGIKPADPYKMYLKKALANRSEILTAKMDLQVKQRESDILNQYLTNESLSARIESDIALEEKKIAYADAENKVREDITAGYQDVQTKLSNFHISVKRLQNSENQYKEAEMKYSKGLISIAELWNFEIARTQARIEYNRTIRDYNESIYRLEAACNIGPGYGGY